MKKLLSTTWLYETVTENGVTKKLHYLTSATGLFAIFVTQNGGGTMYYTLKDHQGSLAATVHGNTVERLSYDAWGNLRNPNTWANYTSDDTFDKPLFDRGYTGHEHLYNFGLINMNGRMYDPVMSSFLSADRYVQDPSSAQGFNRYAYCLYNPLRYVDPTGWLAGGGGGSGYKPGVPYYANGMITINLPEVTIIADNPSLSNTYEYEEYEYSPNITSGGFDNGWGGTNNSSANGRSGGGGGGSGSQGGRLVPKIYVYSIEEIGSQHDRYKRLSEYWQKSSPSLFWDKNGDGKLQKKEADDWWKKANGADVYVNNSLIDWSGLQIPDGIPEGEVFSIETIDAFICLPWETASTYGGTNFRIIDASTVEVLDQMYHYNMRSWNSPENILRNIATIIGRNGTNGTDYMIHYYNPTIKIKKND